MNIEAPSWAHENTEMRYWRARDRWHGKLLASVRQAYARWGWGEEPVVPVRRALARVPRHWYVRHTNLARVYSDKILPLNIEGTATASQPSLMAWMMEWLVPKDGGGVWGEALDVGSGCGYGAALLNEAGYKNVTAIEIDKGLVDCAQEALAADGRLVGGSDLGVEVICQDIQSWGTEKKFQAITVGVMLDQDEQVEHLLEMLAVGGRMIAPISDTYIFNLYPRGRAWVAEPGNFVDPKHGLIRVWDRESEGEGGCRGWWTNEQVWFVRLRGKDDGF